MKKYILSLLKSGKQVMRHSCKQLFGLLLAIAILSWSTLCPIGWVSTASTVAVIAYGGYATVADGDMDADKVSMYRLEDGSLVNPKSGLVYTS